MQATDKRGERGLPHQEDFVHSPILVIGLGNPILGDDGIGWRVAEQVESILHKAQGEIHSQYPVEIDFLSLGGLSLMERLVGYRQALIIDAETSNQYPPGTVRNFLIDDLPKNTISHLIAAHDTNLQTALELGHSMGIELPEHIQVVAVSCEAVFDFSEELSGPVEAAIPQAVDLVLQIIREFSIIKKAA